MWNTFKSSIFAGLFIGIAGFGFLVNKPIGMFLFIFGLASIVSYKLKLFTGTAGFIVKKNDTADGSKSDWKDLCIILIGNIIGCLLVSLMARCSGLSESLQTTATDILNSRLNLNAGKCGIQAIGCGMLMTTAVTFARKGKEIGNWIPLLLAVPMFIHCGFPHCIADAFYYCCVPASVLWPILPGVLLLYTCIVIGNFIGCNIYRIFVKTES